MKSKVIRNTAATAVISLLLPLTGIAGLVIGDWESGLDGWYDWTTDEPNSTVMTGGQTEGVTLGSGSLLLDEAGWGQNLAITLDAAQITAFMENSIFSIDVSVAETPGITSGYSQILEVAFNSGDPGWTPVAGTLLQHDWWDGRPDETKTLEVDYTAFRDQIVDTGYIQIILITNNGDGAPSEMYFDNAQVIPEPATLGLIGIFGGALFLTRRHFRV